MQGFIQVIELLARGRIHRKGQPHVVAGLAWTHLDRRRIKSRIKLEHERGQNLSELRMLLAHHLDGEGARILNQRFVFRNSHLFCYLGFYVRHANAAIRAS